VAVSGIEIGASSSTIRPLGEFLLISPLDGNYRR